MRAQERKLGALVETLEEEKQEQEEAKEEQKEEQKEEEPPKKKKKKSKKKKQAVPEPESNGREQALSYLSLFINSKSDWKFQKVRQMWILQNLYYPNMMDPQQFKDALEYMKDMSPKAKTETGQQAEQILQKLRDRQDLNPQEHQVIKRCKKVIKLCDKV
ncbi:hypothetical protein EDD86DRAFT_202598 [Gorgonomyces haynaldii]|nr:hypothetical protein EDD86DRAFT_202598 [Gorgonomyces haynaldii]